MIGYSRKFILAKITLEMPFPKVDSINFEIFPARACKSFFPKGFLL